MKTLLNILLVICLFGFILSYFAYMLLKEKPDESKIGKLIGKYNKHIIKVDRTSLTFLVLTMILLLISNYFF